MKEGEKEPKINEILALLAAGAFLSLAILAPGLPLALSKLYNPWKKYKKFRLRQVIKRLKEQELIGFKEEGGDTVVTLTEKGTLKTLKFNIDNLKIKEPSKWDGKWRIVLFDIPEKKKVAREGLRRKLKELGFYQLQKSVFVYPYECKEEIDFIRSVYEIKDDVKYMEASRLEEEDFLSGIFGI